jgi:hypothetical protein
MTDMLILLIISIIAIAIYGFGDISRGTLRTYIKYFGGSLFIVGLVLSFIMLGYKGFFINLLISVIILMPLTGFFVAWFESVHYTEELSVQKRISKNLGVSRQELKKYSEDIEYMSDEKKSEKILKDIGFISHSIKEDNKNYKEYEKNFNKKFEQYQRKGGSQSHTTGDNTKDSSK